ncbi:MAG: hypothetical protein V4719_20155 [Planctomycetota bacterium]
MRFDILRGRSRSGDVSQSNRSETKSLPMARQIFLISSLAVCWVLVGWSRGEDQSEEEDRSRQKPPPPDTEIFVQSRDISDRKTVVIGTLGSRLGNLIEIRGKWTSNLFKQKPSGPVLQVTEVNGKPLLSPVLFLDFYVRMLKDGVTFADPNSRPRIGDEIKASGFETGEYIGYSPEVGEEAGIEQGAGFTGFKTRLVLVKYEVVVAGKPLPSSKLTPFPSLPKKQRVRR